MAGGRGEEVLWRAMSSENVFWSRDFQGRGVCACRGWSLVLGDITHKLSTVYF